MTWVRRKSSAQPVRVFESWEVIEGKIKTEKFMSKERIPWDTAILQYVVDCNM